MRTIIKSATSTNGVGTAVPFERPTPMESSVHCGTGKLLLENRGWNFKKSTPITVIGTNSSSWHEWLCSFRIA